MAQPHHMGAWWVRGTCIGVQSVGNVCPWYIVHINLPLHYITKHINCNGRAIYNNYTAAPALRQHFSLFLLLTNGSVVTNKGCCLDDSHHGHSLECSWHRLLMTQAPHDTSAAAHTTSVSWWQPPWNAPHDTGAGCWHYLFVGGVMCPFHANTHTWVYFISLPVKTNSGPASSALLHPLLPLPWLGSLMKPLAWKRTEHTTSVSKSLCLLACVWLPLLE